MFWLSHPTASLARFSIHDTIAPITPGNELAAFPANLPRSPANALSLSLTHFFTAPSFAALPPPPAVAAPVEATALPGKTASTITPINRPNAVKTEAMVIPCSLNRFLILSARGLFLSQKRLMAFFIASACDFIFELSIFSYSISNSRISFFIFSICSLTFFFNSSYFFYQILPPSPI